VKRSCLTIGAFDGVHLGHARLIRTVVAQGRSRGWKNSLVYFPLPPKFVFSGVHENCLITLPSEREAALRGLGLDSITPVPFTDEIASMDAEAFFAEIVRGRFRADGLCVGADFAFGRGRSGGAAFLRAACRREGVLFRSVPFVSRGGRKISSTLVRELLWEGRVTAAAACMGRNYRVSGPVIRGAGLGAKLGYPTANIGADPLKILPPGIFAALCRLEGREFPCVANSGRRPTVNTLGGRMLLEAHILDFSGQIYGETAEVEFLKRLRAEERFPSKEELVRAIGRDIAAARSYFGRRRRAAA